MNKKSEKFKSKIKVKEKRAVKSGSFSGKVVKRFFAIFLLLSIAVNAIPWMTHYIEVKNERKLIEPKTGDYNS